MKENESTTAEAVKTMNDYDQAWLDNLAAKEDTKYADIDTQMLRDRFVIVHKNRESFDHNGFSKWLIEESGEHFATMRSDGHIYIYRNGIYVQDGETYIKTKLDEIMGGDFITSHIKKEVLGHVSDRTYVDTNMFDSDDNILNLANGLYDFTNGVFSSHTHTHMSLCKSAVVYNPDATCPHIDAFIKDVAEPHRIQTIYEMAGYALMPRKGIKRGFILLGKADTGKTQLMNMLVNFVGRESTSTVNPIALARNTHTGADLYGKLLNVIDDLGDAPLAETGLIKSIIGEGMITCNQKNRVAFSFTPNVVNVWGCNVLPKTTDPCFGDKFDVLIFNNVYGGHDKPDRNLISKITTDEEMSGLFNKAIAAYRVVAEEGQFTGSRSQTDRQMDWTLYSCPTAMFVDKRCTLEDDTAMLPKDVFHKLYDLWVKEVGTKREMKREIKSYLESIGVYSMKQTKRDEPYYSRWCYLGIDLNINEMHQKDDGENRTDPKSTEDRKLLDQSTAYRFDPTDPTLDPIMSKTIQKEKSIVSSTIGSELGSLYQNQEEETRSKNDPEKKISGSSETMEKTSAPDIDSKLKHAVGKALSKSDTHGAEIDLITEYYPQIITAATIREMLEERGDSLGIKEKDGKWYV